MAKVDSKSIVDVLKPYQRFNIAKECRIQVDGFNYSHLPTMDQLETMYGDSKLSPVIHNTCPSNVCPVMGNRELDSDASSDGGQEIESLENMKIVEELENEIRTIRKDLWKANVCIIYYFPTTYILTLV